MGCAALSASDFDYDLPPQQIAKHPAPRGESRLLVVPAAGACRRHTIGDLRRLLRKGDLLVLNNTRVIPARLLATKRETGGRVELLVTEKIDGQTWKALVKPAKRVRLDTILEFASGLRAQPTKRNADGSMNIHFSEDLEPLLEEIGQVPLPPYLGRPATSADRDDYQTVFATQPGAVAAPTAGLHFTVDLLTDLRRLGIEIVELTLHVGPGTFRPVQESTVEDHEMEEERYFLSTETVERIEAAVAARRRVVAVGTTVVRALESAWHAGSGRLQPGSARTRLFIYPGYRFRMVDLLMTNFHLPRSTLLMLVCAFAGKRTVSAAYREAIQRGFRFYSYGDAMLLECADGPMRQASTAAP